MSTFRTSNIFQLSSADFQFRKPSLPFSRCILVLFVLQLFILPKALAQSFKSQLLIGVNASQLDGDNLAGFNKLGWHAGMGIAFDREKSGWATELLLHQKGSTESLSFGTPDEFLSITLNYLSLPIVYYLKEWYDPEMEQHRIRVDLGFVPSFLFGVKSTNPFYDDATGDFRKYDLGLTAGVDYRLSPRNSISIRYERSVLKIYKDPIAGIRGLQSYLLNFRIAYHLNPYD